ncbi:MAG: class II aldolase/adducin family protein [Acidimicrobiales bacterium]|nr:class II aldolase/adducin family protein [Acidimicrobiales bacterium]
MGKLEDAIAGSGFPASMPSVPDLTLREKVACAARILANNGYALDVAGHITAMRPDGNMWCTPYGLWWREVSASDIIVLSPTGEVLEGQWDVTPAIYIHTELHKSRPDAEVIIHNHPYYGSLLSTMHVKPRIIDQQACMFDEDIALFDEYTGGVDDAEGGEYLAQQISSSTAIILANHGVLIVGESIEQATCRATNFERTCRLNFDAMQLGEISHEVPKEHRSLLKKSLNSFSVDYYWGGEIRKIIENYPSVLK